MVILHDFPGVPHGFPTVLPWFPHFVEFIHVDWTWFFFSFASSFARLRISRWEDDVMKTDDDAYGPKDVGF